jgi:hypothetical protein
MLSRGSQPSESAEAMSSKLSTTTPSDDLKAISALEDKFEGELKTDNVLREEIDDAKTRYDTTKRDSTTELATDEALVHGVNQLNLLHITYDQGASVSREPKVIFHFVRHAQVRNANQYFQRLQLTTFRSLGRA